MRITQISTPKVYNTYQSRKKIPSFAAHPDFFKYNSTQSCYFRRGAVALATKGYLDIYNTFLNVFKNCENEIKSMLIIGIGNSQETFSHTASIKSILKEKELKNNLDLYVVDLQSNPDNETLWENAFYDGTYEDNKEPKFAIESFVEDKIIKHIMTEEPRNNLLYKFALEMQKTKEPAIDDTHYRVNDEILNFVREAYNNPEKSKWDSPIQDVITDYPDNKFNIISANNVLPYIISEDKIIHTHNHIKRILKPYGYFITDPYEYPYWLKNAGVLDSMREVYKGIYQKVGNT